MTHQTHHRKHRPHWRSLYVWHRVIGVTIALFVLLLAVTGILINHAPGLGLDRLGVASHALLDWYGIAPPAPRCHAVTTRWVCALGERVMLDVVPIEGQRGSLQGAVALGPMIAIAFADGLLLLDGQGRVIERLDALAGLPGDIQAIGRAADGRPVLRAADGVWLGDSAGLGWQRGAELAVQWSRESPPPTALASSLAREATAGLLTWERVLLDLHAGRLFGRIGPWLMDAVAIALVALALSGMVLWVKQRLRRRARSR